MRPAYARSGYEAQTRDPERRAFFDLSKRISELEDELKNVVVDKMPRGLLGLTTIGAANQNIGSGVLVPLTGFSLPVTMTAGRRYGMHYTICAAQNTSAAEMIFYMSIKGATGMILDRRTVPAGTVNMISGFCEAGYTAGPATYGILGYTTAGTMDILSASHCNGRLMIEDVGGY